MPSEAVYFVSDAHLGTDPEGAEAAREARLHDFFNSLCGRDVELVVVGDLFDFWFEYRSAIPRRHFRTLAALKRLRDSNVPITYLAGNHDFWLGRFFRDELGIVTTDGPLQLERQGRRLWIHHGDGLVRGDLGYRVLKRVVRHPWSVALYSLLHPDVGIALAHRVSGWSRHSRADRPPDPETLWQTIARPRFAAGDDAVLVGHFHQAWERHENGRDFVVLGDWMELFTYARLHAGTLSLEAWPAGAPAGADTVEALSGDVPR